MYSCRKQLSGGNPVLVWYKQECCVVFYTTQRFLLIKGGLMEPNGILCEVQPGQGFQFFMVFIYYG